MVLTLHTIGCEIGNENESKMHDYENNQWQKCSSGWDGGILTWVIRIPKQNMRSYFQKCFSSNENLLLMLYLKLGQ